MANPNVATSRKIAPSRRNIIGSQLDITTALLLRHLISSWIASNSLLFWSRSIVLPRNDTFPFPASRVQPTSSVDGGSTSHGSTSLIPTLPRCPRPSRERLCQWVHTRLRRRGTAACLPGKTTSASPLLPLRPRQLPTIAVCWKWTNPRGLAPGTLCRSTSSTLDPLATPQDRIPEAPPGIAPAVVPRRLVIFGSSI